MNLNELIKEQQERNRKTWNDEHVVVGGLELITLDQLTQQTAEAVRDWMVEVINNQIQEINGEGSVFDDFAQDVISQLQANKDLSEKE